MDIELAAARRRIALRHVLLEYLDRCRALHEHRSEISDQRRQDVAALECVGTPDGVSFLAERPEQATDDLRLAVQRDETLLERPRQPHPVVEIENLFARERGRWRILCPSRALGSTRCRRSSHQ